MSSVVRPPDPCLVAIILITSSRAGPRFVYHYPPIPSPTGTAHRQNPPSRSTPKSSDSSPSSDNEDGSSSDEDEPERSETPTRRPGDRNFRRLSTSSHASRSSRRGHLGSPDPSTSRSLRDERRGEGSEDHENPPWESVLGLGTDVWEKLLCPTPSWHKRRFEVGVNDLAFVGWPVFVREDGTWRKKKRKRKKTQSQAAGSEAPGEVPNGTKGDQSEQFLDKEEGHIGHNDFERSSIRSIAGDDGTGKSGNKDAMTMFNVVFVMNPPILEYNLRIKEKYDNVIKKFGKGLKSEQATADYVWKEAQTILHVKEKARERSMLSPNLLVSFLVC